MFFGCLTGFSLVDKQSDKLDTTAAAAAAAVAALILASCQMGRTGHATVWSMLLAILTRGKLRSCDGLFSFQVVL